MEKPNHRPKIYIGSGTEEKIGVHRRMGNHKRGDCLTYWVEKALNDGYEITYIALLCWIPFPPVIMQPTMRALFVVLEAAFAYIFWAMRTVNNDCGMSSSICRWDRSTLEYDGLCSYCCLNETIGGDHDLSPEQLEAAYAQRKEQNRTANEASEARIRKAKTYFCKICKIIKVSQYRLDQHHRTPAHLRKGQDLVDPEKPHKCTLYNAAFPTNTKLNRHYGSTRHQVALSSSKLG
jgi:hypothetical protein